MNLYVEKNVTNGQGGWFALLTITQEKKNHCIFSQWCLLVPSNNCSSPCQHCSDHFIFEQNLLGDRTALLFEVEWHYHWLALKIASVSPYCHSQRAEDQGQIEMGDWSAVMTWSLKGTEAIFNLTFQSQQPPVPIQQRIVPLTAFVTDGKLLGIPSHCPDVRDGEWQQEKRW